MKIESIMKKIALIAVCFFGFTLQKSNAQKTVAYRKLELTLSRAFIYDGDIIQHQQYKNKAFVFGIAVCVNNLGMVDSLIFTNRTKTLDTLMLFDWITKELKKDQISFVAHKNTILVSVALVRRGWDSTIDNFYNSNSNEKTDFDEYFYNILPNVDGVKGGRRVKLLPSIGLVQVKPQR